MKKLTDSQIESGNISLAEFEGWYPKSDGDVFLVFKSGKKKNPHGVIGWPEKEGVLEFISEKCRYDKRWKLLMSIVEKIETIDTWGTDIYRNKCEISSLDELNPQRFVEYGNTKREAVWKACVAFVKWYNSVNQ